MVLMASAKSLAADSNVGASGIAITSNLAKPTTRVIKTPQQLKVLEDSFSIDATPSREAKVELGLQLGLTPRQVQIWFCDRRRRAKKRNTQTIGLPVDEEKEKMGDRDKHASDASTSSSSRSWSSQLVVKLKVPRPDPMPPMLGASIKKEPSNPKPMATQWNKMPNIIEACDLPRSSGAHKRKIASASGDQNDCEAIPTERLALKRVRRQDEASRVVNKGLTEEAIQIFRELRKEAQRRKELDQCGCETQKKEAQGRKPTTSMQQSPIGVPSATGSHGKGSVGYAYCAETGQCFIITRRSPPMCPPRPDVNRTANKKSVPEKVVVEEKPIPTKLEIQDIRDRNRRDIRRAINQGLRNFLHKRLLPLAMPMT